LRLPSPPVSLRFTNLSNQYAQAHALEDDLQTAIEITSSKIRSGIDGEIDLLFAFAAGYSPQDFDRYMSSLKEQTGAKIVLGCSCETAAGGEYELENATALSLWAAKIPAGEIVPMHLTYERGEAAPICGWPAEIDGEWPADSSILLIGEPFSFPVDVLLERFNEDRPGVRIAGGMTSGAQIPGESRLLLNEESFDSGLIAIRISGTPVRMLVSQGCRPIGDAMVVTKAERNIIEGLGGKRSLDVVQNLFTTLPTREQRMFQSGLHVGRVINEYQDKFELGDFLIRNVIGIDKKQSSIMIGDYVRPGQTVQFHIRDHESASLELHQLLKRSTKEAPFASALLFTCNGRGTHLFEDPHHDIMAIQNCRLADSKTSLTSEEAGESALAEAEPDSPPTGSTPLIPTAGFFAAGEIGPVGNKNFLHGLTACVVLFE